MNTGLAQQHQLQPGGGNKFISEHKFCLPRRSKAREIGCNRTSEAKGVLNYVK